MTHHHDLDSGVVRTHETHHEEGLAKLAGGGELCYQVHGQAHEGTPALLLRPLGGSMVHWSAFRALLSEKLRVISFDHRGTGGSSADPRWVTTKGLARDALQLLDHLGVREAHVFGLSLGAMAATWLAILAPSRVGRLCLASAPARGLELTRVGLRRDLALAACFARPSAEVEVGLVDRILSQRFRATHPGKLWWIERPLRAGPASRIALAKHAMAGVLHDARSELGRIRAPTLVLAGDGDTLLGVEAPRALANAIPAAKFELIVESGHDVSLEQPIVTAARVAKFFLSPLADRGRRAGNTGLVRISPPQNHGRQGPGALAWSSSPYQNRSRADRSEFTVIDARPTRPRRWRP